MNAITFNNIHIKNINAKMHSGTLTATVFTYLSTNFPLGDFAAFIESELFRLIYFNLFGLF